MTAAQGLIPAAQPVIGHEEIKAAVRVLFSGQVAQGPEVAAFEAEFADLVGGRHCVAVNSGTSALHMALLALGIGPGDEVVVPSFTFAASANAVRLVGADVVFADIDPDTFCLDPAAAEAAITPRTAAVIPVHLYGHPAAMDQIMALAARHSLAVVEDACHAHGAELNGTRVGAFGAAGTFSFCPTMNMHSLEGGMITVADAELARTLRLLRNQGMEEPYAHEVVGADLRMTDVNAAVGRVQCAKVEGWSEQRISNAEYLTEHITAPNVVTPKAAEGARHVYHQYTVRIRGDREAARARLTEAGVSNAVHHPTPVHRLKPYWEPDQKAGRVWDLPETDRAAAEVVSLPVHPGLIEYDLDRIVSAVNKLGQSR